MRLAAEPVQSAHLSRAAPEVPPLERLYNPGHASRDWASMSMRSPQGAASCWAASRFPHDARPRRPLRRRRAAARHHRCDARRGSARRHRRHVPVVRPAWAGASSLDLLRAGARARPSGRLPHRERRCDRRRGGAAAGAARRPRCGRRSPGRWQLDITQREREGDDVRRPRLHGPRRGHCRLRGGVVRVDDNESGPRDGAARSMARSSVSMLRRSARRSPRGRCCTCPRGCPA